MDGVHLFYSLLMLNKYPETYFNTKVEHTKQSQQTTKSLERHVPNTALPLSGPFFSYAWPEAVADRT